MQLPSPPPVKKVKVIALKAATYKLKATIKVGEQELAVEDSIKALLPGSNAVDLPFVGSGYGTWAVAIVLVTAIIVLGFADILSGEGIIGIFGALAGIYFRCAGDQNRKGC